MKMLSNSFLAAVSAALVSRLRVRRGAHILGKTAKNARSVVVFSLLSVAISLPLVCSLFWWLHLRGAQMAGIAWLRWLAIGCSAGFALIGVALGTAEDRLESQLANAPDPTYPPTQLSTATGRSLASDCNEPRAQAACPNSNLDRTKFYLNLHDASTGVRFWGEIKRVAPEELVYPFRMYAGELIDRMRSEPEAGESDKYFAKRAEIVVKLASALRPYNFDVSPELTQIAELLRRRHRAQTRVAVAAIERFLQSRN